MGESSKQDERSDFEKELEGLTKEELQERLAILESEVHNNRHKLQSMMIRRGRLNWSIEENELILKRINRPPYVVATVNELWDNDEDSNQLGGEERKEGTSGAVVKTSTRKSIYLQDTGLVPRDKLKPGAEVCLNKDSCVIVKALPEYFETEVRTMEVVERPTDRYSDVGGLESQIQELIEAVVLPLKNREVFSRLNVQSPRGVLLYGPPGTGKTLLARACAADTQATFLKLSSTLLVQHYIGEGAKMVRDTFRLARSKAPCIVFIDEIDAIGSKRFMSGKAGEREVQRTMLELLNQLDGFTPNDEVKVLKIHSRQMNLDGHIDYQELARLTEGMSAASCRAVCVEAAMVALGRGAQTVGHEDFTEAVVQVQAKKKHNLMSYT